ncbi:MAG: TRAP transporter small permease [Actinomycetales bacterium]|jgi:TRAP-type C4-dicarboxylate transport system permease small subunit|nr:TRAP transporter small permease [Actinomycetales bacterium]NBO81550.1 TRAP transporter small permease [Betaproteobacteria bacterium]
MDITLARWWRLLELIGRLERLIGVMLLSTIVVAITVQVITRYFFGQPLVWVEELAGYCFLWGVFLGAAVGMKELRHIRIDTFVSRLSARPQALWRALTCGILTACCLIIAVQAWDIMDVESRSRTMSLPVDLPRHLFYSTPLFVCTVSIAFTGLYLVCAELTRAVHARPVDAEQARQARELAAAEADAEADAIAERIAIGARAATVAAETAQRVGDTR